MRHLALILAVLVIASLPTAALVRFDFEDGALQGFKVISGDLGQQPSNNDNDRHYGQKFLKQGRYFIGTYEFKQDIALGELRSSNFRISADMITLLVGGGQLPNTEYVALYRVSDNKELFRETG